MSRQISFYNRRPNLVDTLILKTPGAMQYNLKWATNFDASSWTTFITSPNTGYIDRSLVNVGNSTINGCNNVRVIFNPALYNIIDSSIFWLVVSPVDATGHEMFTTPPLMVIPFSIDGSYSPQYALSGNAPSASAISGSLEIQFPRQVRDLRIETANSMFVAFNSNGPEIKIHGGTQVQEIDLLGTQSSLFVRGNGVVAAFSMLFSMVYTKAF